MKARIKSNGKIVEVISRFMPRKRNAASRDWVCNLSDGTCIDESQLEYIEESIGVLEEAADNHIRKVADTAGHPGWDWTTQDIADAFIAGAKWQAEQLLKSSPLPEDTVLFNKGVAAGKRLMIEEAVEGEVMLNPYPTICLDDCKDYDFKDGDEVRIIIV